MSSNKEWVVPEGTLALSLDPSIESDGKDIFVVVHGRQIAKRGRPGTRHARKWISLVPGFKVISPPDISTVSINWDGRSPLWW